uniref:CSON006026 protein n=1 Tax=Culicoides sonorensis TaxID=179676 RepID=A0A336LJY8_CULSO
MCTGIIYSESKIITHKECLEINDCKNNEYSACYYPGQCLMEINDDFCQHAIPAYQEMFENDIVVLEVETQFYLYDMSVAPNFNDNENQDVNNLIGIKGNVVTCLEENYKSRELKSIITSIYSEGSLSYFVTEQDLNSNKSELELHEKASAVFVYADSNHTEYVLGIGTQNGNCTKNESEICFVFLPRYISILKSLEKGKKILDGYQSSSKINFFGMKVNVKDVYKLIEYLKEIF